MSRIFIFVITSAALVMAQETVALSKERVGKANGEDFGDYNITQSWEFGWRFRSVGGNEGKYRSDVNFGNGIRLLGGRFSMNSRNGNGKFFDELTFSSQGLGNDPYQFSSLRIAKNRWYTYDMIWRENAYYNPALPISFGQHLMDTSRKMQDHDFTLFPTSKVRFFVGFSRVLQDGPGLSTVRLFDTPPNEYPLFMNIHRRQNQYRFGNEFRVFGIRLNWMYSLDQFKESSPLGITQPTTGNPFAEDPTLLQQFNRTDAWKGDTPAWRVHLFREHSKFWALNGRFVWSSGTRNFAVDENAFGTDRFGAKNNQIVVGGDARRPSTVANLTLSIFPLENLTLTNHTAYYNTKIEGNAVYQQLENSTALLNSINFQFLGMRDFTNTTDLNWQISRIFQVHGGYQFAERTVRSKEFTEVSGFPNTIEGSQRNELNAGVFGFRIQPLQRLSIGVDAEIGRQDRPFFPTSDKNYQGFSGRVLWKQKSFSLSATSKVFDNINSTSLTSFRAQTRNHSIGGSWTPRDWFSIDAGYSKLHTNTNTGLFYFVAAEPITGDRSIYVSNLHNAHVTAHFSIRQWADFFIGYTRSQDTGDGRLLLDTLPPGAPEAGQIAPFRAVQTFPMTFESPLARFSVRLHEKVRLNIGYQYYRYREDFLVLQNYRAHTGYTSVLWTF